MSRGIAARLRTIADGPAGALLGGAGYGAWATFANRGLGFPAVLRIGFAHFLMSAAITWGAVWLMRHLYRTMRTPWGGFWFALCGELAITYALLIGVHLGIGTPHVALTLAPGFLPTVCFSVFYATLLRRTCPLPVPGSSAVAVPAR